MCRCVDKDLRVFLGVAKSIIGLLLFFGNFSVFSIFCIVSLDDCTCPQHLETAKFKKLGKMQDLPFISALGHFFFPKFPLTSFIKIASTFLFSSSTYLKKKTNKQTNKQKQKTCQIFLNMYFK